MATRAQSAVHTALLEELAFYGLCDSNHATVHTVVMSWETAALHPAHHQYVSAEPLHGLLMYVATQQHEGTASLQQVVACRFYVTPKSFLDMLSLFSKMLGEQHGQLTSSRERLLNGLAKLNETNAAVDGMQQQLTLLQPTLQQKTASAEQLLAQVLSETAVL